LFLGIQLYSWSDRRPTGMLRFLEAPNLLHSGNWDELFLSLYSVSGVGQKDSGRIAESALWRLRR
jgi:hypothetical protein